MLNCAAGFPCSVALLLPLLFAFIRRHYAGLFLPLFFHFQRTCKRRSKSAAGAGRKVRHLRAKEGGLRWEVKREGGSSLLFDGWSVAEAGEQQRCARGGMGYPAGVTGV